MKTVIYFVFSCLISTGALLGALHSKNPYPAFALAAGIWALFIWGYNQRSKKARQKNIREQVFQDYMRMQYRKRHR